MSRATIKSCKEQAVEFLTERQAIRIQEVEHILLGAIVFCIAFKVTAGL